MYRNARCWSLLIMVLGDPTKQTAARGAVNEVDTTRPGHNRFPGGATTVVAIILVVIVVVDEDGTPLTLFRPLAVSRRITVAFR